MYLCSHIRNLNMAKSTTVVFNLIKKVFVKRWYIYMMFMDTWWSDQSFIVNLSNKDHFWIC